MPSTKEETSIIIDVEILMKNTSFLSEAESQSLVLRTLDELPSLTNDYSITVFSDPAASEHIEKIQLCDVEKFGNKAITLKDHRLKFYTYYYASSGPEIFDFGLEGAQLSEAGSHRLMPSREFDGLWENLIFDDNIKSQLIKYVASTLRISMLNVNTNILPWNKIVLLHGPPGTGKTSLCRALAQKVAIRFKENFKQIHLLEINSHCLFSKWFSESGKLVSKLFQGIDVILKNSDSLLIVMVDEVESLAHSRKAAFAGSAEPSDSIRAVNALLTNLDQIRRKPNVLILMTSNITEAIDFALVDRADIKQYIGLPTAKAIYQIFFTCIKELQRVLIITTPTPLFPVNSLVEVESVPSESAKYSLQLLKISEICVGLSGRTLRKLPLIAHALYCGETQNFQMEDFLSALEIAAKDNMQKRSGSEFCLT